jgi:hypothetical protein
MKMPPPNENTIGVQGSGSGRSIILENLSRVGRALTRSKTSPTNSTKGQVSLGGGWQNLRNTQEVNTYNASDRSIQPFIESGNHGKIEDGVIRKTVDVTVVDRAANK